MAHLEQLVGGARPQLAHYVERVLNVVLDLRWPVLAGQGSGRIICVPSQHKSHRQCTPHTSWSSTRRSQNAQPGHASSLPRAAILLGRVNDSPTGTAQDVVRKATLHVLLVSMQPKLHRADGRNMRRAYHSGVLAHVDWVHSRDDACPRQQRCQQVAHLRLHPVCAQILTCQAQLSLAGGILQRSGWDCSPCLKLSAAPIVCKATRSHVTSRQLRCDCNLWSSCRRQWSNCRRQSGWAHLTGGSDQRSSISSVEQHSLIADGLLSMPAVQQ